jgi:SAM-dependent methyltransferase
LVIQRFTKNFGGYVSNGRILDLGCAKGYLVEMLNSNGYSAIGVDISLTALKKNGVREVDKVRADVEAIPFKDCSFEGILAVHTLEHLPNPHKAVSEVFRVLKRGGVFLAVTPDRDSLIAKIGYKVVKYTALKNPYHVSLMNWKKLKELVRKAGFRKSTILPFHNCFLRDTIYRFYSNTDKRNNSHTFFAPSTTNSYK